MEHSSTWGMSKPKPQQTQGFSPVHYVASLFFLLHKFSCIWNQLHLLCFLFLYFILDCYIFWGERFMMHECTAPSWFRSQMFSSFKKSSFNSIPTPTMNISALHFLKGSNTETRYLYSLGNLPDSVSAQPSLPTISPCQKLAVTWRDSGQQKRQREETWLCPTLTPCHRSHSRRKAFGVKAVKYLNKFTIKHGFPWEHKPSLSQC